MSVPSNSKTCPTTNNNTNNPLTSSSSQAFPMAPAKELVLNLSDLPQDLVDHYWLTLASDVFEASAPGVPYRIVAALISHLKSGNYLTALSLQASHAHELGHRFTTTIRGLEYSDQVVLGYYRFPTETIANNTVAELEAKHPRLCWPKLVFGRYPTPIPTIQKFDKPATCVRKLSLTQFKAAIDSLDSSSSSDSDSSESSESSTSPSSSLGLPKTSSIFHKFPLYNPLTDVIPSINVAMPHKHIITIESPHHHFIVARFIARHSPTCVSFPPCAPALYGEILSNKATFESLILSRYGPQKYHAFIDLLTSDNFVVHPLSLIFFDVLSILYEFSFTYTDYEGAYQHSMHQCSSSRFQPSISIPSDCSVQVTIEGTMIGGSFKPTLSSRESSSQRSTPSVSDAGDVVTSGLFDLICEQISLHLRNSPENSTASSVFSAAILAAPIVSVATGIYNIVISIVNSTLSWHFAAMNILSIITSCLSIAGMLGSIDRFTLIRKILTDSITNTIRGYISSGDEAAAAKDYFPVVSKVIGLCVCGVAATCNKDLNMTKVSHFMSTATSLSTLATDISAMLAKGLGFDFDGSGECNAMILANVTECDRWLAVEPAKLVGQKLKEFKDFCADQHKLLGVLSKARAQDAATLLSKKIFQLDTILAGVLQSLSARTAKPEPVGIYIHGRPAVGKNTFLEYMVKTLSKKFSGSFNDGIYQLTDSTSNHFPGYNSEHTLFFDEVGATTKSAGGLNPLHILNGLMSRTPVPTPGAAIEQKTQVLRPKLVVLASNIPFSHVGTGLVIEATDAQKTRFVELEMIDERAVHCAGLPRSAWRHRTSDFKHVFFRRIYDGVESVLTASEVIDFVAESLIDADRQFTKVSGIVGEIDAAPLLDISGQAVKLCGDVPCSASEQKLSFWIAGPPGSCKSTASIPTFVKVFENLGYSIDFVDKLASLTSSRLNPGRVTVVVLDDLLHPNTEEGQQVALDIWNRANTNVIFLVASNFGPRSSSIMGKLFGTNYTGVDVVVPGFGRRFGFTDSGTYAFVIESSKIGFKRVCNGAAFTTNDIVTATHRHLMNCDFPVSLPDMPVRIPFTAKEADLWCVLRGDESLAQVMKTLIRCSSHKGRVFANAMRLSKIGERSVVELPMVFRGVALQDKTLKVFVRYGPHQFYLNGTEFYCGKSASELVEHCIVDGQFFIETTDGIRYLVTSQMVDAVTAGTPFATNNDDAFIYQILRAHREADDQLWTDAISLHCPSSTTFIGKVLASAAAAAKLVADFLKQHWKISLLVGALVLGVGYFMTRLPPDKPKLPPHVARQLKNGRVPYNCDYCNYGLQRSCPCLHPELLSGDVSAAKGKTKHGRGAFHGEERDMPVKFHNKFRIGRAWHIISDEEHKPDEETKMLLNSSRHHFTVSGGFHNDTGRARMHYIDSNGYKYGYWATFEKIGDEVAFGYDFDDLDDQSYAAKCGDWIVPNIFQVNNAVGCLRAYAVALNDSILRVGTHLMRGINGQLVIIEGTKLFGKPIWECDNDITYLQVVTNLGKPASLPGVKSIVHKLVSIPDIKRYPRSLVIPAHETWNRYFANWSFKSMLTPPIVSVDQQISGCVGVITYGTLDSTSMKVGSCGSPLLGVAGNEEVFLGQLSTIRHSMNQLVFVVCTVEEWNNFMTRGDCAAAASAEERVPEDTVTYVDARHILPRESRQRSAFFLPRVNYELAKYDEDSPSVRYVPINPGLEPIALVPRNHVPVDTNSVRRAIADHAFEPVFGMLKVPALKAHETEQIYFDKIPPDAKGNRRAYAARLQVAEKNVVDADLGIWNLKCSTSAHNAIELGAYWNGRLMTSDAAPMSVLDAIWGNSTILPLKRDTSVGAMFQTMYPGVTKKGDLFGEDRGHFVVGAGTETYDMICEQWEALKRDVEYIYPSSLSMKSECLDPSKLHKKRIIHIVDPVTVVNQRRLFMPIQEAFASLGMKSPFILTANPIADWHEIANQFGKFPHHTALDVSSFDLTVPLYMMEAGGIFVGHVYGGSTKIVRMCAAMCRMIANSPLLVERVLYSKQGGMCSGISNTSLMDSVIMHLIIYGIVKKKLGDIVTPDWFYEHFILKSCGDDTIVGWSKVAAGLGFVADDIRICSLEDHNMKITSTVKEDGELTELPLEQMSFCSRTFKRLPGHEHLWAGQLKAAALSSALCWTKYTNDLDAEEQIKQVGLELACWPNEYYGKYLAIRRRIYPDIPYESLESLRLKIRDQILIAKPGRIQQRYEENFRLTLKIHDALLPSFPIPFEKDKVFIKNSDIFFDPYNKDAMSASALYSKVQRTFLAAKDLPEFLGSDVVKLVMKLRPQVVTQSQTLSRNGTKYIIETPQDFSPSMWNQIIEYGNCEPNRIPAWINTVVDLSPYGTTNAEKTFARKYTIGIAIAEILLRGNLDPYKGILLEQLKEPVPPELIHTPHAILKLISDRNAGLLLDEPAAYDYSDAIASVTLPRYRKLLHDHEGLPTDVRALHSHVCEACNSEFFHSHRRRSTYASTSGYKHHCKSCARLKRRAPLSSDHSKTLSTASVSLGDQATAGPDEWLLISMSELGFGELYQPPLDHLDPNAPLNDEACSEKVASTSGYPVGKDSHGGTVSASTGQPAMVVANPLPAATATDTETSLAVGAGTATTNVLMATAGGVTPDFISQTGYGENLLTLATRKMLVNTTTINVGTVADTIIFNETINPWNEKILNPHAFKWAKMHSRFFGSLRIHVECISSASIIGQLRVYMIPAKYSRSGTALSMKSLDAFPYITVFLNVSGENTFDLTPTIDENVKTGINRESEEKDYGRLVFLTGTKVDNTTGINIQVQLRISASLPENAYYDCPVLTEAIDADCDSRFDLGLNNPYCNLLVDGSTCDTINWMKPEKSSNYLDFVFDRSGYVNGYWYTGESKADGTTTKPPIFISGDNALPLKPKGPGWPVNSPDIYDSGAEIDKNGNLVYRSSDFGRKMAGVYSTFSNYLWDIRYTNTQVSTSQPSFTTNFLKFFYNDLSVLTTYANVGSKLAYDSFGIPLVNHTFGVYSKMKPFQATDADVQVFGPWAEGGSQLKFAGVPIVTRGSTRGRGAPASWRVVRLTDTTSIVPAVAAGVTGTTFLIGEMQVEAMAVFSRAAESEGIKSIITVISDASGKYICTVIRNASGIFIPGFDDDGYSSLKGTGVFDYVQTHRTSNLMWPHVDPPVYTYFKTRSIPGYSSIVEGRVGMTTYRELYTMDEADVASAASATELDDRACSAFYGAAGAIGSMVSGFLRGTHDTENKIRVDRARISAENAAWLERNTRMFQQQRWLKHQTLNARAMAYTSAQPIDRGDQYMNPQDYGYNH